jgi:uncharacterized cupredoxin-like copper-binding protein
LLLVIGVAGFTAAFAATAPDGKSSASAAAVTVNVRGSDTGVVVSPKSFKVGVVTFKIVNSGMKAHVFVVAGKRTAVKPHRSAKASIRFRAPGKFNWTWTGGKKAIIGILTVRPAGGGGGGTTTVHTTTTTATTTTTTATTTTTTTTTPPPTSCTTPTTTVTVGMFEYRFDLDKTTFPAGCIQFVITNRGAEQHNFDIVNKKSGAILAPGATETWSVQLTAGTYNTVCDVPFHIDRGMTGQIVVT